MTRNGYYALHLIPIAMLLAATARWPYGYYTLLRFVVCIASAWLAVLDYQREDKIGPWVVALGVAAILFNPLRPIYLDREVWFFLDLLTAAGIAVHLWMTRHAAD